MNVKRISKPVVILVIGFIYLTGCTARRSGLEKKSLQPPFPSPEYQELIHQGDLYFSKMHLYGWRQAEVFYKKAYEMKPSPELGDKRFLALCLTAIREKHEQIVNPLVYKEIDALSALEGFPKTQKQGYLFEIIQHYRTLPVFRKDGQRIAAKEKKQVDAAWFDFENSPFDNYLYLYFLDYYTYDTKDYNEELIQLLKTHRIFELIDKYAMSPLFVYFNYKSIANREAEVEEMFPQFAEFLLFKGNRLFSKNKLKQASGYYKKVLELIPDYTKAINGIGNIYYFTVKDYETAITYYQQTLDLDDLNPVALFGKGVSLHYLEKYPESNQVFDFMLANQELYHGEAYYYKAYNYYHMKNPLKARELIDQAKSLLPLSGEVFFLSGLLYYNQGKLQEAERDFLDSLYDRQFSHCYPLYYLGMAKLKNKDWSFIKDFSDSIRHFELAVENMSKKLNEIDLLEVEEHQKEWMKKQQMAKLQEFKEVSAQLIQQMQSIINKNADKKKAYEKRKKDEALERVKALLARDPAQLNARDEKNDGATLLHLAVQEGQTNVLEFLLSRGARLDIKDNNNYTPLHWAVMLGFKDIARLLISNGADVNDRGLNRMTPLHDAAYNGHKDIVKMLIANGAKLDARDELGNTPLDLAVEKNQAGVLALLKPLHMAVEKGETREFKDALKKYPFFINARDENGSTPLHLAAAKGNKEILWMLINQGADINTRDIDGFTPMELAAQKGHTAVVQLLQGMGAQPGNPGILAKELQDKQAVLWYLGGHGWAIKTKNHFLIFDYHPLLFQLKRVPRVPLLANGQVNPSELKNQRVFVFFSQQILETGDRGIRTIFSNAHQPVTYISRGFAVDNSQYVNVEHHQQKQLSDMEIVAFTSPGEPERLGYLVKVDGLKIFYPGNRGYWSKEVWEDFTREIDSLREIIGDNEGSMELGIDITFLSVPDSRVQQQEQREEIEAGVVRLLNQLQPAIWFPMTAEGDESIGIQFAGSVKKNQPAVTRVYCPAQRGDRFSYK
jgi:ankyrin repeat protein/tetratricopeptide (TPR) repeat protein